MSDETNQSDSTQQEGTVGETARTIIFAILIALVIRTFAFEPFNIPSSSMVPTLLVGDFLFVSKYAYGYGGRGTFLGFEFIPGSRVRKKHTATWRCYRLQVAER